MFTTEEIKVLMPLLAIGAKKARRSMGELRFAAELGPDLSSALKKIQQAADDAEASKEPD